VADAEAKVKQQAALLAESSVGAVEAKYQEEVEELRAAKDQAYRELVAAEESVEELRARLSKIEAAPATNDDGEKKEDGATRKVVNVNFGAQ
jgi:hypothetical protein